MNWFRRRRKRKAGQEIARAIADGRVMTYEDVRRWQISILEYYNPHMKGYWGEK